MRAELHLARRYLFGLRRRTHVATVSLISLTSLALGVLALVVTLALLEGFQSTIRAELVNRSAHARIRPAAGRALDDPAALTARIREALPGTELVEVVRGTCLVRGVGEAVPAAVEGRSDETAPMVDAVLAARLGVAPGETVEVISPRRRLTPMGPVPVRTRLELGGYVPREPGREGGALVLPLAVAQRVLWGRPVVEAIDLRSEEDPWHLDGRVLRALGPLAQGVVVEGVEDLHRPLLMALALERLMIFVAVGLMLVVAALNLLCNVAMVAAEKRTDLAVLSGLGLGPGALRRLFVFLGLGIGVMGAVLGAAGGVALSVILDRTQALGLPRGVFIVNAVPFRVDPLMVTVVVGFALLLSAAASWLPARLVSLRDPAEGLRYE